MNLLRLLVFVEADADDVEALLVVALVSLEHVRQFRDARSAPRRQKSNNDFARVGDRGSLPAVLLLEIGNFEPTTSCS